MALALARSTLLPGQGFWDTGEFQTVPPILGTAHPTGYPTYVLLGWLASLVLAPFGEPAFRMNLLSALLLGTAAGLTTVVVRQVSGRTAIALACGALLALTPIPWRVGSFADPHMLHLALVAGLLVLLVGWETRLRAGRRGADRWLVAAAGLYGLSLGNHQLTLLLAPGILLFVLVTEPRVVLRPAQVGRCLAALFGVAVLVYLELPLRAAMNAPLVYGLPNTWSGFWYVVLAQQFQGDLRSPFADLAGKVGELATLGSAQLGILAALVPAAFLITLLRRWRVALLGGAWFAVTAWFAASYTNAEIDRYYLGPLLLAVTWLGIGAAALVDLLPGVAGSATDAAAAANGLASGSPRPAQHPVAPGDIASGPGFPGPAGPSAAPRLLAGLVSIVVAIALVIPGILAAPATRTTVDLSRSTGAADWSGWVFAAAPPSAVIVSWWSYSTPLWYRQRVLGERPDLTIDDDRDRLDENLGSVDDVIRANLPARPVYLIRQAGELADLGTRWVLEEVRDPLGMQSLYRVVGPAPATP